MSGSQFCPTCERRITRVTINGPNSARAEPCGHHVKRSQVTDSLTQVIPDGGTVTEERLVEIAQRDIKDFHTLQIVHCHLCNQIYTNWDQFYVHRQASETLFPDQFDEETYTEINSGERLPDSATLGFMEACEPNEEADPA